MRLFLIFVWENFTADYNGDLVSWDNKAVDFLRRT